MVLSPKLMAWLLLLLAALTSAGVFATVPQTGLPLAAVLAALLPLQLAAVFWLVVAAPRAVERRFQEPTTPASD